MLSHTESVASAVFKADPTISPADCKKILEFARSVGHPGAKPKPEPPQILTRKEVAETFHRTTRYVDQLAAQGILERVRMPGRVRSCGYRLADVIALIEAGASREGRAA